METIGEKNHKKATEIGTLFFWISYLIKHFNIIL